MTKQTITVYSKPTLGLHPGNAVRHEKFLEMFRQGKTDGRNEVFHRSQCDGQADRVVSMTVYKFWIDQAAAEEWRDFLVKIDKDYDQGLADIIITDI